MGFKRFLAWLAEKLIELHLGVVALLAVKVLLPVTPDAYVSLQTFAAGVRDTGAAAVEDALYSTQHYMNGSWAMYALDTYVSAVYVIGWYVYASSLYLLLSLLAAALAHRHYRLWALGAFGVAAAIFCWRFVHVFDARNLYMGTALFGLGAIIVLICAGVGSAFDPPAAKAPSRGRVRLDFSE